MSDIVERLRAGEPCIDASAGGYANDCKVKDVRSGCLCAIAAAEIEKLRAALRNLVTACNAGRHVSMGAGGMTIEAQTRNSVINGVSAWAVCEAEEVLDGLDLGGQP